MATNQYERARERQRAAEGHTAKVRETLTEVLVAVGDAVALDERLRDRQDVEIEVKILRRCAGRLTEMMAD